VRFPFFDVKSTRSQIHPQAAGGFDIKKGGKKIKKKLE
jgi:hypothetical protein